MNGAGAALAAAAETLVGTPFRLHGREAASGLDCVGLVAAALAAIGRPAPGPRCYGLRNHDIADALVFAARAGLIEAGGAILTGDVLLVRPAPLQHHLLIALGKTGFVHAHAGLRRVVVTPGPLASPLIRHWRLA